MTQRDYGYDVETYPNIFTLSAFHIPTMTEYFFEVSEWRDDRAALLDWLRFLIRDGARMVGFNNLFFDYTMLHHILRYPEAFTSQYLCDLAGHIIRTNETEIWPSDVMIPQVDLYRINHFDNQAKRTGLKAIEFAMHADSVEDLPFPPNTVLTWAQAEVLRKYNRHDTRQTIAFYHKCLPAIVFRQELTERYGRDFTNHNDTKVGKDYLIMQLGESLCYDRSSGRREPRQTIRHQINLGEVVFPYIQFEHPEFNRILNYFKSAVITETKGTFAELSCTVDGFQFDFGTGGIHGSITSAIVEETESHAIVDLDVTSYYPSLSIANRIYPAHLSDKWCDEHTAMKIERAKHDKGTALNALYKLGLNGSYGDTNNVYSPFYDPAYTMAITINGQLLLCMLAEQLMKIPGLKMIQANTDGVTVYCPRIYINHLTTITQWWEQFTRLQLERNDYRKMWLRDVNNYIAIDLKGKVKRKGAYEYERAWHQNHSGLVIPKAVEAYLVHGVPLMQTLETHPVDHDFCLMTKAKGSDVLRLDGYDQQKTLRYYVTREGGKLVKHSPPPAGCKVGQWKRANSVPESYYQQVMREIRGTSGALDCNGTPWDERIHTKNRSTYTARQTEVEAGRKVLTCNQMFYFMRDMLDLDYYLAECRKLVALNYYQQ